MNTPADALKRSRGLFVRINLGERALINQAAAADGMRAGEWVRAVIRRDAERLLGAADVRQLLARAPARPITAPR